MTIFQKMEMKCLVILEIYPGYCMELDNSTGAVECESISGLEGEGDDLAYLENR
jgi:hypothetical protein